MRLSTPATLVGSILSLGISLPDKIPPIEKAFDKIAAAVRIPLYEKSDITKIINKINAGVQSFDVLNEYNYSFPCNRHFIEQIISVKTNTRQELNILSTYAFNSYLSWLMIYEKEGAVENIDLILQLLEKTFKCEFQLIASTCFAISVHILIDEQEKFSIYNFLNSIIAYITIFPEKMLEINVIAAIVTGSGEFQKSLFDNFILAILDLHKSSSDIFTSEQFSFLMDILISNPHCFSYSIFGFLEYYHSYIEKAQLLRYLELVGPCINRIVQTTKSFEIPKIIKEPARFEFKTSHKMIFKFHTNPTFPNGLHLDKYFVTDNNIDLITLYSQQIQTLILSVKRVLCLDPDYLNAAASSFIPFIVSSSEIPKIYNIIGIFLSLCSDRPDKISSSDVSLAFVSSKIFDNYLTIYNSEGDLQMIGTMRNIALDCILCNNEQLLYNLLLIVANCPLQMAEVLNRLSNKVVSIGKLIKKDSILPKLFSQIGSFYQKLHVTNNQVNIDEIEIARTAYFIFIKHLMNDQRIFEIFFSDSFFLQCMLSFLFEEVLQNYAIEIISSYIQITRSAEFISPLQSVIALTISSLPSPKHAELLLNLLNMLNENLAIRRNMCIIFSPICPSIIQVMLRPDILTNLFETCATFLAIMSPFYTFNVPLNERSTIFSDKSEEFINHLFVRMIQLLAGDIVSAIFPTFIVKQPIALKVMILMFYNTKKIKDVAYFALNLCKFSPVNIQKFASIDLSKFLTDILEEEKKTPSLDEETIGIFLNIYGMIAVMYSNAVSAIKFISLLTPTINNTISNYQIKYFDCLNYIASTSLNEPKNCLSLNGFSVKNKLDGRDLTKEGFTVTAWVYIAQNENSYKVNIWEISDTNDAIGIFLQGSKIYFHQTNGDFESQGKISVSLQLNNWHFVAISYSKDENTGIISYAVDANEFDQMRVTLLDFTSHWENATMEFGGNLSENVPVPSRVTNTGLFRLLFYKEILKIYEIGFQNQQIPFSPFLFFRDFHDPSNKIKNGFVDIIIERCGVACLLPLFSMNDLRYSNGEKFDLQFDSALSLLINIVMYSTDSQILFYHAHGFHIFIYLIMKYWIEKFSLKIYNQLIVSLTSFKVDMLQQQLFDCVLCNVRFLFLLNPNLHLRILQLWSQSIFPNNLNLARNMRSVSDILDYLKIYYYYEKNEKEKYDEKITRNPKLQIKKCRQNLLQILLLFLTDDFSETDFISLVEFCKKMKDEKQIEEVCEVILQVIVDSPSSVHFNLESPTFYLFVNILLSKNSNILIQFALTITMTCKNAKLLSNNYLYKLQISFYENFLEKMDLNFFENIMSFLQYDASILPLAVLLSVKLNLTEKIVNILKILPIAEEVFPTIWPFILFDDLNDKTKICEYFIKNNRKRFELAISTLNSMFGSFSVFCFSIKQTLFVYYFTNFEMESEEAEKFIITASKEIFFSSPKNKFEEQRNEEFSIPKFLKPKQSELTKFGLVFGENDKWKHLELAICCLSVFEKYNCRRVLGIDLILSAFLLRNEPRIVTIHLEKIDLTEKEFINYKDEIDLISYHSIFSQTNLGTKFQPTRITCESYNKIFSQFVTFFDISINNRDYFYDFMNDLNEIIEKSEKIFLIHDVTIINRQNTIEETGHKLWIKLWETLSSERGPWSPPPSNLGEYEVDKTLCYGLFTAKTKRINKKNFEDSLFDLQEEFILEMLCEMVLTNKMTKIKVSASYLIIDDHLIHFKEVSHIISTNNLISKLYILTVDGLLFILSVQENVNWLFTKLKTLNSKSTKKIMFSSPESMPLTESWKKGEISTLYFISYLNMVMGRSSLEKDSQPIFPQPPSFIESGSSDCYTKGDIMEIARNRTLLETNNDNVKFWFVTFLGYEIPRNQLNFAKPASNFNFDMKYSKAVTATFTDLGDKPQCHVLNREGIIFHSILSLLEEENIPSLSQTKTRLNVINNAISYGQKFFVSLGGGDLIVINSKSGKTVTIETGFSMITHISSDDHLIALCGNDNVVDVFGISERNVCHINLFRDFPSCICVSSVFHTVVCGTEDGTVLVYSSNDGILAHSTNIDLPLLDVSVSPTLGAIICHANDTANEKHRLTFMTIDCQQYGSVSLNKLSNMRVFKTKKLEDFVVCFHLDYGLISVIEVSSLKVKTIPCEIFTNILCVEYSEILGVLLITTEDGFIKSINIDI